MKRVLIIFFFLLSVCCIGQTTNDVPRTVTMKEYVDMKVEMLQEMDRQREQHLSELNKIKDDNIKIALAAITEKLIGMNEFRGSLEDQTRTFITKSELKAWIMALVAIIGGISGIFWGYSRNLLGVQQESKRKEGGREKFSRNYY